MRLKQGVTRFVILHNDYAYKIGKVRPIRHFFRIISFILSPKRYRKFLEKYGKNYFDAFRNDFLAGLYSNKREFYYYNKTQDSRVIPTVKIYFSGWIIIQERALEVTESEFEKGRPNVPSFFNNQCCETDDSKQFGKLSCGKIVLVDYGRFSTVESLENTATIN